MRPAINAILDRPVYPWWRQCGVGLQMGRGAAQMKRASVMTAACAD